MIARIFDVESDYGCEERPDNYKAIVVLTLRSELGDEIKMEVLDDDLYKLNINEGDCVSFDVDNKIFKEE